MGNIKKRLQKPKYEYQILINREVVWHGINARKKLVELAKKYPKVEIGIKWVPKEGVLIADADDVPPILGRFNGLDLFEAVFYRGKETRFLKE
jgi:hypothetical protein